MFAVELAQVSVRNLRKIDARLAKDACTICRSPPAPCTYDEPRSIPDLFYVIPKRRNKISFITTHITELRRAYYKGDSSALRPGLR